MSKPEWGVKRQCTSCGTRFYDLKKNPITCPKCGAIVDTEAYSKVRRMSANDRKARSAPAHEVVDPALLLHEDELASPDLVDDVLIEDAEDLDQDASDVIEEIDSIEHIDHEEE